MNKPDILMIIENEGIDLKRRGKYLWALCPFHPERYPSFKVDPERQSFYCFGCHKHGDVVTFLQKHKNFTFKEAISYLGIDGKLSREALQKADREKRKKDCLKQFKAWCNDYHSDLSSLLRCLWKAKQQVKDEADLEKLPEFYHREPVWLYQIEILQSNDDEAKLKLYKEVRYGN